MQHTKKLLLVDPNTLERERSGGNEDDSLSLNVRRSTASKALDALDDDIKNTLESNLPSDIKAKLYLASLHKFRAIDRERVHQRHLLKREEAEEADKTKERESDLLASFPDSQRHLAKGIYRHLTQNPDVQFSNSGELIYRQSLVPRSHLIDLVQDVLKTKNQDPPPAGHNEFINALKDVNVPKTLVLNTDRWKTMHPELFTARRIASGIETTFSPLPDSTSTGRLRLRTSVKRLKKPSVKTRAAAAAAASDITRKWKAHT
jgi:hypothetical protein